MSRRRRSSNRRPQASRFKPQRPKPSLEPKKRLLIVGDGKKTEPNYFRALKQEECVSERFVIVVKPGTGGCALDTMKRAVEEMESAKDSPVGPYDEVWCALDVEGSEHRESLDAARKQAGAKKIKVVLSNPCFECWFLAHFDKTSRMFADGGELARELDKHWQKKFNRKYDKTDANLYVSLKDHTQTAIHNACQVREQEFKNSSDTADCNSSTEVYRLVAHLLGTGHATAPGR